MNCPDCKEFMSIAIWYDHIVYQCYRCGCRKIEYIGFEEKQ